MWMLELELALGACGVQDGEAGHLEAKEES